MWLRTQSTQRRFDLSPYMTSRAVVAQEFLSDPDPDQLMDMARRLILISDQLIHKAPYKYLILMTCARKTSLSFPGRALWGCGGRNGRQGEDAKRPSPLSTEWDQYNC